MNKLIVSFIHNKVNVGEQHLYWGLLYAPSFFNKTRSFWATLLKGDEDEQG